jgi:hypothetical protein
VPQRFAACARADGLQRPVEALAPCAGTIPFALRPFEVRGFVLRQSALW